MVLTGVGGTSYVWSTGATTTTINVATTGTYSVTVINSSGCSATSAITNVTVNARPTINASSNSPICVGASLNLSSTTGFVSYNWTGPNGFTSISQNPTIAGTTLAASGTYTVTVTNAVGCSASSSTVVLINALPTVTVTPTSVSVTTGVSSTLTASGANTYAWSPSVGLSVTNTAVTIATPVSSTAYVVTGTDLNGCKNTATATIIVNGITPTLIPGTIGSNQTICLGIIPASFTSTTPATGGTGTITYQWQSSTTSAVAGFTDIPAATATTYLSGALTQTTYFRRGAKTTTDAIVYTSAITISVNNLPSVSISPASPTVISGSGITLTASGADSYAWIPVTGLSASNTAVVTASPITTTTYTVSGTVSATGCVNTASVIVTIAQQLNPDFGVTNVNVPLPGNVSTNDLAYPGSSYGTPNPVSGNPAGGVVTMNSNGTFVFTSPNVGVYNYYVPVCASGQSTGCPVTLLQITVKNTLISINPPIANPDIVTVPSGSSVTVNELGNDQCANVGCSLNPSSVTITVNPTKGTSSVNPDGTIKYTPNAGFVGLDSLTYRVCDNSSLCTTSKVYITVTSSTGSPVTYASDDYNRTNAGVPVSGNVLPNDRNTAGNTLSVTSNGTPLASQGTIVINTDGSYVFTPAAGFTGPVDVIYTACAGTPSACATATLHILVDPAQQLNPDFGVTNVNVPLPGNVSTNDLAYPGSSYGTPNPVSGNPAGGVVTMNSNGTFVFTSPNVGVYNYYVPVCASGQSTGCPVTLLQITVKNTLISINPPIANPDIVTVPSGSSVTVNELGNDQCANVGCSLNPSSVTITVNPTKGTSSVNPDGTIKYTPNAGFVGLDSLTYRVCDNSSLCTTSKVYITVTSSTGSPVTYASDDYNRTNAGVPVSGNVLPNDRNTAGNTLSVTSNGTPLASQGTIVINTDGSYVFTPAAGFTGPVDVIYTACAGTPSACATATLHILVDPLPLAAGTIAASQTICRNASPNGFTSTSNASGGSGTINYQWQSSTDNVTFTNIPGATNATYAAGALTQTTYYRRAASTSTDPVVYAGPVTVTVKNPPVIGSISGPCAIPRDSTRTFSVIADPNATTYVWTLPNGWTGTSTTNSINVKVNNVSGAISVTAFNGTCQGNTVSTTVAVIDYTRVTLTGLPVVASGNNNSPVTINIQLFDVNGNKINCSGGVASVFMCDPSNPGTFSPVIDNGDGTYTTQLTASANDLAICGSVGGVPVEKKANVTFTGPQGGISANGPIFDFETPKLTFTFTAGRSPYTVIYRSAKSNKNDTLTNVTANPATYNVPLIPSTTLYRLVSIIDANGERRDNNFNRDTATIRVVAPRVIITLHADPATQEIDSSWKTKLTVKTKNIGEIDLFSSQALLNLKNVFPSPVTYTLDSVVYSGTIITPNKNYDGVNSTDLFAKINSRKAELKTNTSNRYINSNNSLESGISVSPDGSSQVQMWSSTSKNEISGEEETFTVTDNGDGNYMFGALSNLPVGAEADIILYLHVKPNGYTEPFVMQAVALGTGRTAGATSLATSLSNDNNDISTHPEITKQGDPIPAVINLFPRAVIGGALAAGTPVLQGNGTYNVPLTLDIKDYGNVNLINVNVYLNLLRMIGAPSTFTVVGPVTSVGNLVPNPAYDGKLDTNLVIGTSQLGLKGETILKFTVNITPNQISSIYRLQAIINAFGEQLSATVTDLSTDGANPDPDGDNIPSEKIITTILINLTIPPLVPANIGIQTGPTTTVPAKSFCGPTTGVVIIPITSNSGGLDPYEFQWQISTDNVTFQDIAGATSSTYTTGAVNSSIYLRRGTISGSQLKYSNSVFIQIFPVTKPTVTASGPLNLTQNGSITLTSSTASSYLWSNGGTTKAIVVNLAGKYTVNVVDANGCSAVSDTVKIFPPPPVTVDATYIIGAITNPANSGVQVTGLPGAVLNYYLLSSGGVLIPVPVLPGVIGTYTYYVSQTMNGFESVLVPYKVTMLDPYKVADLQKVLSKAPVLQADGSFILGFKILSSNLRSELLDSIRIKDDLSKVFPGVTQYSIVDIKASGKLIANQLFNGSSQIDLLNDRSQLAGFQTDSVEFTVKVFPNGFAGVLLNQAEQTAKSPYGVFKIISNDPTVGNGVLVRNPTKFTIPIIDIFIPEGFSPNHDGTNDFFVITKPFNTTISMELFNRWGNLVYKAPDYKNEFDGRGNQPNRVLGEELPDGTYYYIIIATNTATGTVRKFAGFITIKR